MSLVVGVILGVSSGIGLTGCCSRSMVVEALRRYRNVVISSSSVTSRHSIEEANAKTLFAALLSVGVFVSSLQVQL